MNRNPLQIALQHGAAADVINQLIKYNKDAVTSQSIDGKSILHMIIDGCKSHWSDSETCTIIKLVSKQDPKILSLEDNNGISALEYSILNECGFDIVRVLCHLTKDINQAEKNFNGCESNYKSEFWLQRIRNKKLGNPLRH